MSVAYKLVDRGGYSRRGQVGETSWLPVGTVARPTGKGTGPCGPGVLHAYVSPEVAAFGNFIHGAIDNPRCLRVEIVGEGAWETDGLKRWTTSPLRVVEEVPVPALTTTERVAWAICIAPHVSTKEWAIRWLSGEDRSKKAAWAAWEAAANAWEAAKAAAERGKAEAAASAAEAAAGEAAEATAANAAEAAAEERYLLPALRRARAILARTFPAERYDEVLGGVQP